MKFRPIFYRIIILLACQLTINVIHAQNFSTMGDNFWFGFMQNLSGPELYVYVSSDVNTAGTISVPGQGWTQNFNVTAGASTEIQVPTNIGETVGSGAFPKGIHIVTDDDVAVYALNFEGFTSDASVVTPVQTLGSQYYVMAYKDYQAPYSDPSQFLIIAAYDNTTVEITPTVATLGGNPANTPFQVTLNAGEVYQVQSNDDLSGSLVTSIDNGFGCSNFALFAGNICTGVICAYCDHLNEQMFSTSTWGEEYILPPLKTRNEDRYRIMASINGTQISINGAAPIPLNAGQYHEFNTGQPSVVTSTNPVSVMQYSLGGDCDGAAADPFTINLSPVEQTLDEITFNAFTSTVISNYYLNVVTTTANTNLVNLDGNPVGPQFNIVPSNPFYSYAQIDITQGNHTIQSDSGLVAYVYGYGQYESYGYSAGANLSDLRAALRFEVGNYTDEDSVYFICPNDTILFRGEGDSSIIGWEWTMGDGSFFTGDTVYYAYDSFGVYEVNLIVERVNLCAKDTIEKTVKVVGPEVVIAESDSLCFGDSIQLQASGAIQYLWNTGDSSDVITVSPTNDTLYWVQAIDSLCPGKPDTVNVHVVKTQPDFYQDPVCLGDTNFFLDQSTVLNDTISNWHWNFGNGNTDSIQNPSEVYIANGNYNVSLNIETGIGCRDTMTKALNLNPVPIAQMEFDNVCRLDEFTFIDSSNIQSGNIASWSWSFGDTSASNLQNPSHTYDSAGFYNVQLVITSDSSCTDTAESQIQVYELPEADFTTLPVCKTYPSIFSDSSNTTDGSINNWLWNFGNGDTAVGQNQQYYYTDTGNYTVQLNIETNYGCKDSTSKSIKIYAMPRADFLQSAVCLGDSNFFYDNTIVIDDSVTQWLWTFDGIDTASTPNPSYLFDTTGSFDIHLQIKSSIGCVDSIHKTLINNPQPNSALEFDNSCRLDDVAFQDSSSISTGSIVSWNWHFGDSSTSSLQSPVHFYDSAGFYTVQLVVKSDSACKDTNLAQIQIFELPEAGFEALPVCNGLPTVFNDSSVAGSGTLNQWTWDFGNNDSATGQQQQVTYADPGIYTVSLMVENSNGCLDTVQSDIEVYARPNAHFNVMDACLTDTTFFTDSSSIALGSIVDYNYSFGDGNNSILPDPSHLYTNYGDYDAELIVTSNNSCKDTFSKTLNVHPLPQANFTFEDHCFGKNAVFTDSSSIVQGQISQWTWDLGDNSLSSDTSPSHFYATADTYAVTLDILSDKGCADSIVKDIVVFPLPDADFEVDPVCFGIPSIFNNTSSISSGNINAYNWQFTPSDSSDNENPQFTFSDETNHSVYLTVESDQGCRDSIEKVASVYSLPDVAFDFSNICFGDTAFFNNQSIVNDGVISDYHWSFNGNDFYSENINYSFSDSGIYNITLIAESDLGCIDSASDQIEVYPLPSLTAYTRPACYGENNGKIYLYPSGGLSPYTTSWSNGSDLMSDINLSAGDYTITVSDENNCLTDTLLTVIQPHAPIQLEITPDSSEIVFGTEIQLTASGNYDPYLSYEWFNAEDLSCTYCPDPIASPLDYTLYTVEATDSIGCTGQATAEVYVDFDYIFYAPSAFSPNGDGVNDEFKVFAKGVKNIELRIFDRWGELLYLDNDIEKGWDGYYNNELMVPAVYVYTVLIEYKNGVKKQHDGSLTLIR